MMRRSQIAAFTTILVVAGEATLGAQVVPHLDRVQEPAPNAGGSAGTQGLRSPGLPARLSGLRCPAPVDPLADSIWKASAARYADGALSLYYAWRGTKVEEIVSEKQLGYGNDSGNVKSEVGTFAPYAGPNSERLLRDPPRYAVFERRPTAPNDPPQWRYSKLETEAASHFVSTRFAEHHTLVVLGRTKDATVIGFCPRATGIVDIEGELRIGKDGWLRAARWHFRVPHSDEDAGGEAAFVVERLQGAPYLVSVRGAVWHRTSPGFYHQERFQRQNWRIGRTIRDVAL
jgi:hypothetical protein